MELQSLENLIRANIEPAQYVAFFGALAYSWSA